MNAPPVNSLIAEARREYLAENARLGTIPAMPARDVLDVESSSTSFGARKVAGVATVAEPPRPLRRELPPAEPFPIDALGDVLGGAARGIVDKIQCPAAMAASSVLAVASLATQAIAGVTIPATGHVRPLSLYCVSVAASGERKSGADCEALAPVRKRESDLREQYEEDKVDYGRAKRAFDVATANAEKTKGDAQDILRALEEVGDEPPPPLIPILTSDEPTIEGLHRLFEKGHPSLGLFADEGGTFLGGHALAQEHRLKTLAALSNLWDGAPIRRIRAGDGASVLPGRCLAVHLMLQPDASSRLLSDAVAADQGLLSRLLVCAPASTAGTRFQKPRNQNTDADLRRYSAHILNLLERPYALIAGTRNALEPRKLIFDQTAASRFLRLCDAIERRLGDGGELESVRGFANKLAEHIARIAGVLTVIDDPDATTIAVEAFDRAALVGDFYTAEALRLFEAGASSPELRQAERLLGWLKTGWSEPLIGLRAIYRQGPNSIRDAANAKRAVTMLEDHGWLVRLDGGGHVVAGQPVREAWRVVRES